MTVYYIMIFSLVVLCLFAEKASVEKVEQVSINYKRTLFYESKVSKFFVFLIFVLLAFVAAFRYKVGTDFHSYYRTGIWAGKFENGNFKEPGFTLFSLIASFLFDGKDGAVTMLSAIVTVALFVFTIAKRSDNITISMLLFVFTGCFTGLFNGIRQYLATAIMFAGFHYVYEKKFTKWLLVVLLASTIHITAILMILVYFTCNLKTNYKTLLLYFSFAAVALFLYEPLFDLVGALKQDEINSDLGYMSRQVNILRVLVQCVPLIMMVIIGGRRISRDVDCRALFNVSLLNAALAIASMNSAYFSRFYIYTMCFQVLMYPKVLSRANTKVRTVLSIIMILCYAVFWYYEVSNSSSLNDFHWLFVYL